MPSIWDQLRQGIGTGLQAVPTLPTLALGELIKPNRRTQPARHKSIQPRTPTRTYSSGLTGQARIRNAPGGTIRRPEENMDVLFGQLADMLAQNRAPVMSPADMQRQASIQAAMQFDPQMQAIRQLMRQTTRQARTSQEKVGGIYEGLARSYRGDIKETKKEFKKAKEIEKARVQNLTEELKKNYTGIMNEYSEQLQRLGIEAAGGETIGDLTEDLAHTTKLEQERGQREQRALGQEQRADVQFYRAGRGVARMEGAERQSDIEDELREFLRGKRGELGIIKSQKQLAYQSALAQLQNQMSQQAQEYQDDLWSKLIQLGKFRMQIGKYQQPKQRKIDRAEDGLSAASEVLTDYFTQGKAARFGPQEAQRYMGFVQQVLLEIGRMESDPVTGSRVSPEQAASIAHKVARRNNINPTVLSNAVLAYFGRR